MKTELSLRIGARVVCWILLQVIGDFCFKLPSILAKQTWGGGAEIQSKQVLKEKEERILLLTTIIPRRHYAIEEEEMECWN